MSLTVQSVRMRGFMNVTDPVEIDMSQPGLYLILGDNGSGKSSRYSESLCWALFGKTVRNVSADQVINRASKEAAVTVRLLDDWTKDTIIVERSKARGKSQDLQITREPAAVKLSPPSPLFPSSSTNQTQDKFEDWLGLDFNAFSNSIVFGQGSAALFAAGLSDQDRKRIFDRICGLDEYDEAFSIASESRKVAQLNEISAKNSLSDAQASLESASMATSALLTREAHLQAELSEAAAQIEEETNSASVELEEARDLLASSIHALETVELELSKPPEVIDISDRDELNDLISSALTRRDRLVTEQAACHAGHSVQSSEYEHLFKALEDSICPYCSSEIVDKTALEADILTHKEHILDLSNALTAYSKTLEELNEDISAAQSGLRDIASRLSEQGTAKRINEAERKSLRNQVSALKSAVASKEKSLASIGAASAALEGRLDEVKTEIGNASTDLQVLGDAYHVSRSL